MPVSSARAAAFEILMRIETTEAYASELLHAARFAKLSPEDHRLLTELVMGVLRWRSVLDAKIADLSQGSPKDRSSNSRFLPKSGRSGAPKFDVEVLTALRLGAYQLLFLDRVPTHAAVNESVELVKIARKRSAAGLVNAVLRRAAPTGVPQFSQNRGEVGHPSDVLSHPRWLVERWERIFGAEAARKICEYDQAAPQAAVRAMAFDQLATEGIQHEPGKLLTRSAIVTAGEITRTKAFHEHRLVIQDEASQLVALIVGAGKAILDCCAAPGGKTRILAERNPNAIVLALELRPRRAALLRKLVSAENVRVVAADVRQMPLARTFDRILVDAPCSGTGTLARNPEIKWRLKPGDILRLQAYQIEILSAAMKQVSKGGRIVYSTCSLEPEENQEVIEQAIARDTLFRVVDCGDGLRKLRDSRELAWEEIDSLLCGPFLRTIPGVHPCDGFFAAVLERQ